MTEATKLAIEKLEKLRREYFIAGGEMTHREGSELVDAALSALREEDAERERLARVARAAKMALDYHQGLAAICRTELGKHDSELRDALAELTGGSS